MTPVLYRALQEYREGAVAPRLGTALMLAMKPELVAVVGAQVYRVLDGLPSRDAEVKASPRTHQSPTLAAECLESLQQNPTLATSAGVTTHVLQEHIDQDEQLVNIQDRALSIVDSATDLQRVTRAAQGYLCERVVVTVLEDISDTTRSHGERLALMDDATPLLRAWITPLDQQERVRLRALKRRDEHSSALTEADEDTLLEEVQASILREEKVPQDLLYRAALRHASRTVKPRSGDGPPAQRKRTRRPS